MFSYQLTTSFILIYFLSQNINTAKASVARYRCQKNDVVWFCSDGKQCGDQSGSCKGGVGAIDTNGIVMTTIFAIFILGLSSVSIYYFCTHGKRMAAARLQRQIQATVTDTSQQHVVYRISSNASTRTNLPITEISPPSYEPTDDGKLKDERENV